MPSYKSKFTVKLKKEFEFLTSVAGDEHKVLCTFCGHEFSIANGGKTDIKRHIESGPHLAGKRNILGNRKINDFMVENSGGSSEQLKIAAEEIVFAFHAARHGLSLRAAECTSSLIRDMFEPKFSSAKAKTAAIVRNVVSPMIDKKTRDVLGSLSFLTILTDTSNRKYVKLLPIIIRGFSEFLGVVNLKLDVKSIPNETSDTISTELLATAKEWNITEKLVGFAGDNCNINFGGVRRTGINNVFHKLKTEVKHGLVGIGCTAHIAHNALDAAVDQLPFDIEAIVVKIYKHFHIFTVRVERLKSFCDEVEVTFSMLTNHSSTRFLSLHPAVIKIIEMFPALKEFFKHSDTVPPTIQKFFESKTSLFWLKFLESQ